ncbi:MAG: Rrf2 family transcriptional regulator [Planctomycetes bacterium]|nr:Rrf2 family transcriptional regulator [Planctomycetota bacterium]
MAIGQFFSQRFGYAVHALAYVAKKKSGELSTLPELADWMRTIWPDMSETYLSNVVQRLARGGLLRSHRGVAGGYSLSRKANKINLRDMVELLEGVELNRCGLSLEGACPVQSRCSIQGKLQDLELSYLKSLAKVTIAELAGNIVITPPRKKRKATVK